MVKDSSIIKDHASKEIRKWWNVRGNVTLLIPISINYLPYHKFCRILREGKRQHLTGLAFSISRDRKMVIEISSEITFTAVLG